jgi:hypothetical protein
MRHFFIMAAGSMLISASAFAQSTDVHSKDRAYIQQAESDWAESVATNDATVIERIIADDFVGVDIDGSHYSKSDMRKWREHPSEYVSNHMDGVQIRFYGDAAVAQGSESWKKKDRTTGKFVWTDTWIRRADKWQIVAAEDLVPPPSRSTHP